MVCFSTHFLMSSTWELAENWLLKVWWKKSPFLNLTSKPMEYNTTVSKNTNSCHLTMCHSVGMTKALLNLTQSFLMMMKRTEHWTYWLHTWSMWLWVKLCMNRPTECTTSSPTFFKYGVYLYLLYTQFYFTAKNIKQVFV